jgi:hypothetical protein
MSVRSAAGRARYIRESYGSDEVPIDTLISPLRYDVLLREGYFRFLDEISALSERDLGRVVAASRDHPYHRWFREILVPRYLRSLVGREHAIEEAFAARVARTVELYRSFLAEGYDHGRPLSLRTGLVVTRTATGKRVPGRLFAGDGCHRLALLRLHGERVLKPRSYRVRLRWVHRPVDHTHSLLRAAPTSRADYVEFLSLAYDPAAVRDAIEAVGSPRRTAADAGSAQSDLRQVVARDFPLLRGESASD